MLKQQRANSSMTVQKTRNLVKSMSSVCLGIASKEIEDAQPVCYPSHWTDGVHEEDSGCDERGTRPQQGIEILKEEPDALTFKTCIATATDDVSG